MTTGEIPSPCIGVCALDIDDVCQGCYRTGQEITDWFMAGEEQRLEILQRSTQRRREAKGVNFL